MSRAAVVAIFALLVLAVAGVAWVAWVAHAGGEGNRAALAVFVGSADTQRFGQAQRTEARTGDLLANGDTVFTGAGAKAQLTFPDGSVTRLDSSTEVTVNIGRAGLAGDQVAHLAQASGLTWNVVRRLTGGAQFRIDGPNQTAAEVRGTEFGYYVEKDPTGAPVIWVDVWAGQVRVTGPSGPAVDGTTGQRVTVRQGQPAAAAVAIPAGDRQLEFTVFNNALDAQTGTPLAFSSGTLATDQVAGPIEVAVNKAQDLQFVLAWPGSAFELTVIDPSGKVYRQVQATRPPVVIEVPKAAPGTWQAKVRDAGSPAPEAFWLIASRR